MADFNPFDAASAIVNSDGFCTTVNCLNHLYGVGLDCADWSREFGVPNVAMSLDGVPAEVIDALTETGRIVRQLRRRAA